MNNTLILLHEMGGKMSVVCISNSKGGTGKTLISLNLIYHIQPKLIIDADIHKGISNILNLGSNTIEIKHADSKQQIIEWTKTDNLVLIDCGGFDSDITRYALSQADYIITPTTDDPTDQFALIEFNKVMQSVSLMVNEKLTAKVILNRVHHGRKVFRGLDSLLEGLEYLERLPVTIPQSALLPKAAFKGEAVKKGIIESKFNEIKKHIEYHLI